MARPALGCGLARVKVYDRNGVTVRGILNGGNATTGGTSDLTWSLSKSIDGSSCSFTASALEPAMVSNPSMLEDALAIVELNVGGVWTAVGTPYVLSPGSGTAIGTAEGAAYEFQPSCVGAAVGLPGEWLVLHSGGIVNRRGPTERYIGWQSASFVDTAWNAATVVTAASLTITAAKYGQPNGWPAVAAAASWVYRNADEGGLSLFRFGSFTVTTQQKYLIGFSCDEESKVYLDGPGYGGVVLESSDQETGYTIKNVWSGVLAAGTYYVSAEMTTISTLGGDTFDACRMYAATVNNKGRAATVVLKSDSTTKVWRQQKTAVRPGFTPTQVVEQLRSENATWGIPSASLLSVAAGGTMPTGEERVWPVGTTVAQVLADLEVDVSWDVTTAWVLTAWANRGTDLSATIAMTPGAATPSTAMNVEGAGWTSDPVQGTRAVVLTNDGFVQVINSAAEVTTKARGMYLESGASGSIAKGTLYALDAITQAGQVRRNYHVDAAAVTSKVPFVNYTVSDKVNGLNHLKAVEKHVVLSITGTNQTTRASFSLELGVV